MANGWQNNPPLTISDSDARGDDVYEVLVTGWGFVDGSNQSALQWPPAGDISVPVSVAGIAIGPRSTVDRCWISYNLARSSLQTGDGLTATDRLRYLSRDAPLIYTQQAPSTAVKNSPGTPNDPITSMVKKGCLYVYPAIQLESTFDNLAFDAPDGEQLSTVLPSNHDAGSFKDVNGVVQQFGTNPNVIFTPPTLHLLMFLKGPPVYTPQKRSPLLLTKNVNVTAALGVEQPIAQLPMFGRRSIHVTMMAISGSVSTNFRVGAIRGFKFSNSTDNQESPIDSITGVAAGVPVTLSPCAGQDVYADYLNLYATVDSNNAHVLFQVTAYD